MVRGARKGAGRRAGWDGGSGESVGDAPRRGDLCGMGVHDGEQKYSHSKAVEDQWLDSQWIDARGQGHVGIDLVTVCLVVEKKKRVWLCHIFLQDP